MIGYQTQQARACNTTLFSGSTMKLVFNRDTLPRKLARTVFYTHCAIPFAFAMKPALAADTQTLPAISVTAENAGTLNSPAAVGSNLGLTPLQTPASVDVITREQLEERGDATIIDAITRAAGISGMGHPGNGNSSLSARGFTETNSVMRLYDGTRQYGGVGVSFPFDTWSIDRIEVLRGPASVI
jgi:iron complex outermembrane receptor protein